LLTAELAEGLRAGRPAIMNRTNARPRVPALAVLRATWWRHSHLLRLNQTAQMQLTY
jgi:hypothetical protein